MIPDYLDPEAFEGYCEMRKLIKKPQTDRAKSLLLNKLEKFYNLGYDVNEMLDEATEKNWLSVYPNNHKKQAILQRLGDRSWIQ